MSGPSAFLRPAACQGRDTAYQRGVPQPRGSPTRLGLWQSAELLLRALSVGIVATRWSEGSRDSGGSQILTTAFPELARGRKERTCYPRSAVIDKQPDDVGCRDQRCPNRRGYQNDVDHLPSSRPPLATWPPCRNRANAHGELPRSDLFSGRDTADGPIVFGPIPVLLDPTSGVALEASKPTCCIG